MRVVTQNLLGLHMGWPRRLPAVVSWFRRLRPDVLTLQEAVVTADYDQVTEILGFLDATPSSQSIRFLRGITALDGTSVSYRDAWELVHGDDGEWGSDHFGVVADVELVTGNW